MRIAAVVVNHNTPEDCATALGSIWSESPSCHVVVVNVACRSEGLCRPNDSRAETIDVKQNIGFGTANNIGVAALDQRWDAVLLLNADARLHEGCLNSLVRGFESNAAGAVGPRILSLDGSTQMSCARPRTTPVMVCTMHLSRVCASASRWWIRKAHLPAAGYDTPGAVASLSGACMMVSRRAWLDVGGFDERLFLYWEDVDLCARLADRGWGLVYVPSARCTHIGGQSGGYAAAVVRAECESALVWIGSRFGAVWTPLLRVSLLVEGAARLLRVLFGRRGADAASTKAVLGAALSRRRTRPFIVQALGFAGDKAGGLEATLLEQCDLARREHGLSSVVCLDEDAGWLAEQLRARGHTTVGVGGSCRERFVRQCWCYFSVMRHYSTAAVVGHFGYAAPGVLLAAWASAVPRRIVVRHSLTPGGGSHSPSIALMRRLATRWVAVSPAVETDLIRLGVEGRRIVVSSVGLAASRIPAESAVIESWIAGRRRGVVALSEARPEKGLDHLVRALGRPEAGDAVLAVYGGGGGVSVLAEIVADLDLVDRVVFKGRTDDAIAVLLRSQLLVLPSLSEAAPLVLLECMSAGTPFVATRVGGVPEVAAAAPATCHSLVPAGDSEALARAIARLLVSPPCIDDVVAMRRRVLESHASEHFHSAVLADVTM